MSTAVIGAPEFRARSGRKVQIRDNGTVTFDHANGYLSPETAMDAEEFFQAQKDLEIGRWRFGADPDYLVYPDALSIHGARSGIRVWNERTGVSRHYADAAGVDGVGGNFDVAARAYFEAHPESKPWQDAKPGETWRLTVIDRTPDDLDLTFNVIGVEGFIDSRFARAQVSGQQMEYPIDSPAIVAGRRIWPEDAS